MTGIWGCPCCTFTPPRPDTRLVLPAVFSPSGSPRTLLRTTTAELPAAFCCRPYPTLPSTTASCVCAAEELRRLISAADQLQLHRYQTRRSRRNTHISKQCYRRATSSVQAQTALTMVWALLSLPPAEAQSQFFCYVSSQQGGPSPPLEFHDQLCPFLPSPASDASDTRPL